MAYFIPSFLQKRLLRYALTRLDLLDIDALALENLDISWGKKSTIELRDVALKAGKISTWLKLPPTWSISQARLALLRLTVPADLHHSGILIELHGVSIVLDAESSNPDVGPNSPKSFRRQGVRKPSRAYKADRPRSSQSDVHDPGGTRSESGNPEARGRGGHDSNMIPTPADLAQSFLEAEPKQEKEELESVLLQTQSQTLEQSEVSAYSSEGGNSVGFGSDLALPTFLANFFRDVTNRIQVKIEGIQVDFNLCLSTASLDGNDAEARQNNGLVTFRLTVDGVSVASGKPFSDSRIGVTGKPPATDYTGSKRTIILRQIQLILLSESQPLSLAAQSTMPSPKSTHSTSSNVQTTFPDKQSTRTSSSRGKSVLATEMSSASLSDVSADLEKTSRGNFRGPDTLKQRVEHIKGSSLQEALEPLHPGIVHHSQSPSSGTSVSPEEEDLTESKLYSHEDAVSMHMSAMDQELPERTKDSPAPPGGWHPAFSDDNDDISKDIEQPISLYEPISNETYHAKKESYPPSFHGNDNEIDPALRIVESAAEQVSNIPTHSMMTNVAATSPVRVDLEEARLPKSDSTSSPLGSSEEIKRPFALAKRVLKLANISILLPGGTPQRSTTASESETATNKSQLMPMRDIELSFGLLELVSDMALTKTILLALQQIYQTVSESDKDSPVTPPVADNRGTNVTVVLSGVLWRFLDSVESVDYAPSSYSWELEDDDALVGRSEVLLKTEITALRVDHTHSASLTNTSVSIKHFSFGYDFDPILSFNSDLKMRESTRDVADPAGAEVYITITKTSDAVAMDLTTLPVHIVLDSRRLDETFGWFGGLSSMLELGNSMISTITPKDSCSTLRNSPRPKRSVHFERSSHPPTFVDDQNSIQNKMTVRLGGLLLEMQGQQASLETRSTAVKIVKRAEGLGVQIDRLKLRGPCGRNDPDGIAASFQLSNVRIEYLEGPKDIDLARLIELVFPSNLQDEDEFKDGLMVDMLLRQRRQGGVIRMNVEHLYGSVKDREHINTILSVFEDLKKLSTIAKYLPEDDRPGIMILSLVKTLEVHVQVDERFGLASCSAKNAEVAHVTFPSLAAFGLKSVNINRNDSEELLGTSLPFHAGHDTSLPVILARYIGNEMIPVVRIRIHNLRVEYHVSTIMALMGLEVEVSNGDLACSLMNSVATLTARKPRKVVSLATASQRNFSRADSDSNLKLPEVDFIIKDVCMGLNPHRYVCKGYVVLEDAQISASSNDHCTHSALEIKKASLLVLNNATSEHPTQAPGTTNLDALKKAGYVLVGTLRASKVDVQAVDSGTQGGRAVDVDAVGGLLLLETCADSTQTLQTLLSDLSPPIPKGIDLRYRTEAIAIQDMLASFTGNAFVTEEESLLDDGTRSLDLDEGDMIDDDVPQNPEYLSSFYNPPSAESSIILDNSMMGEDFEAMASQSSVNTVDQPKPLQMSQETADTESAHEALHFREDHFGPSLTSARNEHVPRISQRSQMHHEELKGGLHQLKAQIKGLHVIWNLFDGYDWQSTRDQISRAVTDVQAKANERLVRTEQRKSLTPRDHEEDVIGDFLFNSIYIGVAAKDDPSKLTQQVNHNIDELASETGSYATSSSTRSPNRQGREPRARAKSLRLGRSKHHKMTFELQGISADIVVHPPRAVETQSAIVLRVQDLDIFDHLPTSTWKKFATYMQDAGEREDGTPMVHLTISNVKPMPDLAASEMVIKVSVLPLRLHVDQDALDFMSRFFEFRDNSILASPSEAEAPFFQRVEVNTVRVRLDFKPKRVDYAGLRSGHTTEFMNLFVLDRADMFLRHVIIYGISGFDRLGQTLNDIWMPDVKQNQLPGVLAGLGPVRSLVNVGTGVRDLVVVPITEYRKDGRVFRSFQKGALAFAKTTTSELAKLGAKLAIGTQTILQGAEDLLSQQNTSTPSENLRDWTDAEIDAEEREQISLYAKQPVGVVQGLRGAYASLERDLLTAKDAIIAMPGEVMESGTAGGAAKAVMRNAPTVILRPAMGVSKAVGQTLMGATNSLDPGNRQRVEDKYKRH